MRNRWARFVLSDSCPIESTFYPGSGLTPGSPHQLEMVT